MTICSPASRRAPLTSYLQDRAWTIANASYQVPDGDAYRAYARELYDQDLHERILALFARLDAQNAQVEALLLPHSAGNRKPTTRTAGCAAAGASGGRSEAEMSR